MGAGRQAEDMHLALCLAPGVGSTLFQNALQKASVAGIDADAFFEMPATDLSSRLGLPPKAASELANPKSQLHATIAKYTKQVGTKPVRLLTPDNVLYP